MPYRNNNGSRFSYLTLPALLTSFCFISGCAVQTPVVVQKEAPTSLAAQRNAQELSAANTLSSPILKRKIALGRISNETTYGRSLLRDQHDDPLGKQVTDLLSKSLTESGSYLV